jgi:hypothetical protein
VGAVTREIRYRISALDTEDLNKFKNLKKNPRHRPGVPGHDYSVYTKACSEPSSRLPSLILGFMKN